MARRKRSPAEDLIDVVGLMPWWVGILLAIVSYFVLHSFAGPSKMTITNPNQVGDLIVRSWIGAVALVGQFLVPLICLCGALGSFLSRRKRRSLVQQVVRSKAAGSLQNMTWREFEMLVSEAFRIQGYQVTELGGAGPDGGVDLVLRRGNEKFFVQCKQWKAYKVGVDVVRELYGVMAAQGATGGFVMTSGSFSPDAEAFASGRNVKLVDGTKLFGMIQQGREGLAAGAKARHAAAAPTKVPDCPKCNGPMVQRTAKKGSNAGSQFWGCGRFPACTGTR